MINLAIVGSRIFTDRDIFAQKLNEWINIYGPPDGIISGGAKGADSLGEEYAKDNNIPLTILYPDWQKHGRSGGLLRNTDIVNGCTHILAFPSRHGKGTQDTIRKGKLKQKVMMIHYID